MVIRQSGSFCTIQLGKSRSTPQPLRLGPYRMVRRYCTLPSQATEASSAPLQRQKGIFTHHNRSLPPTLSLSSSLSLSLSLFSSSTSTLLAIHFDRIPHHRPQSFHVNLLPSYNASSFQSFSRVNCQNLIAAREVSPRSPHALDASKKI